MELSDLRLAILTGEFDAHLDVLIADLRDRKNRTAPKAADFVVGETVKFGPNTNPKYLIGTPATIVKINRTKVVVDLAERNGRFFRNINCPTAMLVKV